jgi:hypothetical protein
MIPVGLGTKDHCTGEDQQQFRSEESVSHGSEVDGYQPRVFSCIDRRRNQATASEDIEDLVFALVICSVD